MTPPPPEGPALHNTVMLVNNTQHMFLWTQINLNMQKSEVSWTLFIINIKKINLIVACFPSPDKPSLGKPPFRSYRELLGSVLYVSMDKSGKASHPLYTVSEDSFVFSHCPLLCYQEQLWSQHLWQIRVIWLELTFPIVLYFQVEKVAYLCTLQGSSELYKSSPAMRSSGLWEDSNAHYDSQSFL